jgi:hypothetical protein
MAIQAHGITIGVSTTSSNFDTLGELTDISPPSVSKDVIETTNHGSSGVKSYIGGLVDFGEVSITVNYNPDDTEHTLMRNLAKAPNSTQVDSTNNDVYYFQITYTDATPTTETFQGIVTSFEQEAPIDGQLSATFTVKITGSVTYA